MACGALRPLTLVNMFHLQNLSGLLCIISDPALHNKVVYTSHTLVRIVF